jgi:hypothetical protein
MKAHLTGLAFAFGIGLLASGCGGGGSSNMGGDTGGGMGGMGSGTTAPPATSSAPFDTFVKEQLAQTSDTSDPVDVNDRQFEFSDDDEMAFSDVL